MKKIFVFECEEKIGTLQTDVIPRIGESIMSPAFNSDATDYIVTDVIHVFDGDNKIHAINIYVEEN